MKAQKDMQKNDVDPVALLQAHMACADKQLHQKETRLLEDALGGDASNATRQAVYDIQGKNANAITLDEALTRVPVEQQQQALNRLLHLACADGLKSPEEQTFFHNVAQTWGFSRGEIKSRWEAERAVVDTDAESPMQLEKPSLLVLGIDAVFGPGFLDGICKSSSDHWCRTLANRRQGGLLAGPEYSEAVERCSQVAQKDFDFVHGKLENVVSGLEKLQRTLAEIKVLTDEEKQGESAKDAEKTIHDIRTQVKSDLSPKIDRVKQSLAAKHRALRKLTIAFLGKTKAGKSTLHAVVTGGGWDGIGKGGQRTTQYNRVYEWRNLRIIDTPGIGAAEDDGRSDEEIAESVVDEADIVCFVVTDDSQQQSEFAFLERLKQKAKPLIILLNVKSNLDNSKRVERFLRNPDRVFKMEGDNDLLGHVNRIRRYTKESYGNDFFDIIPTQLYAAQLARRQDDSEYGEKLWAASRIQDFLNGLQMALVRNGPIRRSQTLLGSTVCDIRNTATKLNQHSESASELAKTLSQKKSKALRDIDKAAEDAKESADHRVRDLFEELRREIPDFAERHWDDKENQLTSAWERRIEEFKLNDRLQELSADTGRELTENVQAILSELGREMENIGALSASTGSISGEEDTIGWRGIMGVGGALVSLGGAALAFTPLGWGVALAVGIVGGIVSVIGSFFTSKAEKRRKAANKISQELCNQVNKQEKDILEKVNDSLSQSVETMVGDIGQYFELLIEGLKKVTSTCEDQHKALVRTVDEINAEFARRILEWLAGDSMDRIPSVQGVEREPGRRMTIHTDAPVETNQSEEAIQKVLQEELVVESNQRQSKGKQKKARGKKR